MDIVKIIVHSMRSKHFEWLILLSSLASPLGKTHFRNTHQTTRPTVYIFEKIPHMGQPAWTAGAQVAESLLHTPSDDTCEGRNDVMPVS